MIFEISVIVLALALMVVSLGSIISAVFHAEPDDDNRDNDENNKNLLNTFSKNNFLKEGAPLQVFHQYVPDGNDVAEATGKDEEVEDGMHEGLLV